MLLSRQHASLKQAEGEKKLREAEPTAFTVCPSQRVSTLHGVLLVLTTPCLVRACRCFAACAGVVRSGAWCSVGTASRTRHVVLRRLTLMRAATLTHGA